MWVTHFNFYEGTTARVRVGSRGSILVPLALHVHELIHGTEIPDLVKGARFDLVLSLLAKRRLEELNFVAEEY